MSFTWSRLPASGVPLLPADLSAGQRGLLGATVVVVHALLAWLVLHSPAPQPTVVEPAVITATLVTDSPRPDAQRPAPATPVVLQPTLPRALPRSPTALAPMAPAPATPPVPASAKPAQPSDVQAVQLPVQESKTAEFMTPPVAHAPVSQTPAAESAHSVSVATRELPMSAVRYLFQPKLVYPRASLDMGETGVVSLRFLVDEEGRPRAVQVSKGSGFPRLDRQAVQYMNAARFQPHIEGGGPVATWVHTEIVFNLE